jgi:hypothetical protein
VSGQNTPEETPGCFHLRNREMMMKIGIILDDWKLPLFKILLTDAGYSYTDKGSLSFETTLLLIETDDVVTLKIVIENCQAECLKSKLH